VRTMYTSWEGENGLYMKIYKWSISGEVMSIDIAALNLKVQNIDISFLYADIEKMEFGFSWRFGTSVQAIVGTKFRIYMENGTSLQAVVEMELQFYMKVSNITVGCRGNKLAVLLGEWNIFAGCRGRAQRVLSGTVQALARQLESGHRSLVLYPLQNVDAVIKILYRLKSRQWFFDCSPTTPPETG
jgi:hypothetical protein